MNKKDEKAVLGALEILEEIADKNLRPSEALQCLEEVKNQNSDMVMNLLWQEEAYDKSLHYDILLRNDKHATISMSYCRDQSLPWPLRGVHHYSEANVVQVNGRTMTMEEAVVFLDVIWNKAPLMEQMLNTCLVKAELEKNPINNTDEELQIAMDCFRFEHGLLCASETSAWLEMRGMTHDSLEHLVEGNLCYMKLKTRIAEGKIETYFDSHQELLRTAMIARISCPDKEYSLKLANDMRGVDFYRDLEDRIAAGENLKCRISSISEDELSVNDRASVFNGARGDVLSLPIDETHCVVRIISLEAACLDQKTEEVIVNNLFEEWLREKREVAQITWHWGQSDAEIDSRFAA